MLKIFKEILKKISSRILKEKKTNILIESIIMAFSVYLLVRYIRNEQFSNFDYVIIFILITVAIVKKTFKTGMEMKKDHK